MDELTLLRRARSDAQPSPAALNRGRAALLERAASPATTAERPPHRARRRLAIGGLSTIGAAALAGALVMTDIVGLTGWRGSADPAAAAALSEASAAAIAATDPVLAPGQFLEVRTRAENIAHVDLGEGTTPFAISTDDTLYRPADPADDWVWVRGPQTVAQTFGAASAATAAEWTQMMTEENSFETGDLLRAPAGTFYGGAAGAGYDDLTALPRDPYRLLNYIYRATLGAGPSPDTEALVFIADRLRIGNVPADLRAAMYQAAAMIPGVEFLDDQVTLDGRTGVAIGREEQAWGSRVEIIVDPKTGTFIGEREILVKDQDGLPAGTVTRWSAVTTTITDSAPPGGTVCGKMTVNPETGQC